jgi:hypothetical protein
LDHFDGQAMRAADLFHLLAGLYDIYACMFWIYEGKVPYKFC